MDEEVENLRPVLAGLIDDALDDAAIDSPVSDDWSDVIAERLLELGWRPKNGA